MQQMCRFGLTLLKSNNNRKFLFNPWKRKPIPYRYFNLSRIKMEKSTTTNEQNTSSITQNDCCGNGCANCILDMAPLIAPKKTAYMNKKNIVANYKKFYLLSKKFHTNQLTDVIDLHFSCVLDVGESANDYFLDIQPGYHIMMRAPLPSNDKGEFILRPYSPYWVNMSNFQFKIIVNLAPNGPMSQYIKKLQPNDFVEFRGPLGRFQHNSTADKKTVIIISQGIAIAPTLPIINEILENKDDMSKICHFCCFVDFDHIYFRNYLQEFNKYWNYKSYIYLSKEQCDKPECIKAGGCTPACEIFRKKIRYNETITSKRLDGKNIFDICKNFGENNDDELVICGSRNFMDFMEISIRKYKPFLSDSNVFML